MYYWSILFCILKYLLFQRTHLYSEIIWKGEHIWVVEDIFSVPEKKLKLTSWLNLPTILKCCSSLSNLCCGCGYKMDRGIGQGDHFLPHKFIERTFEHWANSTKQLLNARRGHQAPRNAAHCLWKEVGQNIKDKKRDKIVMDGDPSWERVIKRRNFQTTGNPLTSGSVGSLGISEGNITRMKNKCINKTHRLQA